MNCYYILGKNTIDNFIWNRIEKKRKVVGAILDGVEGDLGSALLDDVIDYLVSKKLELAQNIEFYHYEVSFNLNKEQI